MVKGGFPRGVKKGALQGFVSDSRDPFRGLQGPFQGPFLAILDHPPIWRPPLNDRPSMNIGDRDLVFQELDYVPTSIGQLRVRRCGAQKSFLNDELRDLREVSKGPAEQSDPMDDVFEDLEAISKKPDKSASTKKRGSTMKKGSGEDGPCKKAKPPDGPAEEGAEHVGEGEEQEEEEAEGEEEEQEEEEEEEAEDEDTKCSDELKGILMAWQEDQAREDKDHADIASGDVNGPVPDPGRPPADPDLDSVAEMLGHVGAPPAGPSGSGGSGPSGSGAGPSAPPPPPPPPPDEDLSELDKYLHPRGRIWDIIKDGEKIGELHPRDTETGIAYAALCWHHTKIMKLDKCSRMRSWRYDSGESLETCSRILIRWVMRAKSHKHVRGPLGHMGAARE